MLLIFDNYDSFTFNLCDYFKQLGQDITVVRNDEKTLEELESLNFQAIVISPGPGIPQQSGILMAVLERWHNRLPILGICLGHQAIGQFFGAKLVRAVVPMHGKVSKIKTVNHPLWNNIPMEFSVCRYHSLVIKLPENSPLQILAESMDDHEIMAITHRHLPVTGIQFHPEAILTENGMAILFNWLNTFTLQIQTHRDS